MEKIKRINTKENYRPVSILPNLSKIFERCIFKRLSPFFENILANHYCGLRKGLSSQQFLLVSPGIGLNWIGMICFMLTEA